VDHLPVVEACGLLRREEMQCVGADDVPVRPSERKRGDVGVLRLDRQAFRGCGAPQLGEGLVDDVHRDHPEAPPGEEERHAAAP